MKPRLTAASTVLIVCAASCMAAPRDGEPADGVPSVQLGGRSWLLAFEDPAPRRETIEAIESDLEIACERFDRVRLVDLEPGLAFPIEGRTLQAERVLDFSEHSDYLLPEPLQRELGPVVSHAGRDYLVVSRWLVRQYERALELRVARPEEYRSLSRFLTKLNELAHVRQVTGQLLLSLFYLDHLSASDRRMVISSSETPGDNPFIGRQVVPLSVLSVSEVEAEDGLPGTMSCRSIVRVSGDGPVRAVYVHLIHDDGAWKLVFPN